MSASFLEAIDWHRPWLQGFRQIAKPIVEAADWRLALNAAANALALRNDRGLPIRFVRQADLPQGVAYEAFIGSTGCVPTRENLHDFFNAMMWLHFPQTKRQLNALQAAEIEKAGDTRVRGTVRDAATIFDENAALIVTADGEWLQALRQHRWQDALFASRSAFGRSVDVVLFGHALQEKLVAPYKAITAHGWAVAVGPDYFEQPRTAQGAWLDAVVAAQLRAGPSTADFTPLPVLGVPGWADGQDAVFYADTAVFRPKRR